MKTKRSDTMLCEKDALQDMLDAEKLLMNYYAVALTEGSSTAFRKEILRQYSAHEKTQFCIFEQMLARGYYEVQPAPKLAIDQNVEKFSKVKKQMCKTSA